MYAAQQGLAQKVGVKMHQYGLAFALSNFKLQGRTLPKLILSVCKRSRAPWMTLASFYVLISRVRELAGLRLLQEDSAALSAVSQFKTDEYLHGWERGYDAETGLWDDALAARAVRELRKKRDEAKKAALAAKKAAAAAAAAARKEERKQAAAAAAAQRRQQQAAARRATEGPAPAPKRRCYTCGKCRAAGLPDEGHTAQSRKCPRFGM